MNNFKNYLILSAFYVFLFTSCSQEISNFSNEDEQICTVRNTDGNRSTDTYLEEMEPIFNERENLAVGISCLPHNEKQLLFSLFNNLCTQNRENGYYDKEFFFFKEKDMNRMELGNLSIEQLLLKNNPNLKPTIDFLCQNDRALSVLLVKDNNTDIYNDRIYVDNEIDDQNLNATVSYAYQCSINTSTIAEEPSQQSFVIREAESSLRPDDVNFNNSLTHLLPTKEIITSCGEITIFNYQPPSGPNGGGGGDPGDPCDEECDRDCIDCKENMHKFRARDDYDGWLKGEGEWNFYVIYAEGISYSVVNGDVQLVGDALSYVIKRDEGVEGNNEWRTKDFDIIRWNLARPDGDRMKYVLYEDDKGKARDINIPLKFSIKIKIAGQDVTPSFETAIPIRISKGDDFIGESIVDYCDNLGFEYHPGSNADFVCNERCN
jgi:hypothetical protein